MFQNNVSVPLKGKKLVANSYLRFATTLKVGIDMLSVNVCKKLAQHAQ